MLICVNCVVIIGLLQVSGLYAQSPCPEIFQYRRNENGIFGLINVPSFGYARSILVKLSFTIATNVNSEYAGSIEPLGSELQLLENFNQGIPIQYRVNFPVTSPLPRITSLSVNDNVVCYGPGDVAGPNQYVTTVGLQHILYYKSGGPSRPQTTRPPPPSGNGDVYYTYDGSNANIPWEFTDTVREPEPVRPRPNRPPPPPPPSWDQSPNYERPPNRRPPPKRPPPERHPEPETEETPTWLTQPTEPPRRIQTQKPVRINTITSTSYEECGIIQEEPGVPLVFHGSSYERGKWPWLVALFKRKYSSLSYICSGTLVSDRHVVSAAHCMMRKSTTTSMQDIVIKSGVHNLDNWAEENVIISNLKAANIHESYNASSLANDILLMTLEKPLPFNSYIRPACLWSGNTDLSLIVGGSGVVAGWGANEFGPAGKGEPRKVQIPIVSTATCRASKQDFHRLTSSNTICAGDRNGSGPCLGDSGGGLFILDSTTGRWRLRGVVSVSLAQENGEDSCNLNEFIVFTDTAQYLPWIKKAMSI